LRTTTGDNTEKTLEMVTKKIPDSIRHLYLTKNLFSANKGFNDDFSRIFIEPYSSKRNNRNEQRNYDKEMNLKIGFLFPLIVFPDGLCLFPLRRSHLTLDICFVMFFADCAAKTHAKTVIF